MSEYGYFSAEKFLVLAPVALASLLHSYILHAIMTIMRHRNTIIALGFVVILIQFLGFPQSWKSVLYPLAGLIIIALAYVAGRERANASSAPASVDQTLQDNNQ